MRAAEVDHQLIDIDIIETARNENIVTEVTDTIKIVNHRLKFKTRGKLHFLIAINLGLVGTPAAMLMIDHLKVLLQEEEETGTEKEDQLITATESQADITVIVEDIPTHQIRL